MGSLFSITKKIAVFLKKILIFLLILFLGAFFAYLLIPSPAKTTRQFFLYLKNENYEKAYQLIDGQYKKSRGSMERFTNEYANAVVSGTRTQKVTIKGIQRVEGNSKQYIVHVTVRILYRGDMMDSDGSYLLEKIPGKGWKIVQNVSSIIKK